ncbi:MAG TPA: hypothetical protein VN822_10425, partial [Candidatus Acidoferrales bacterium]|nr:hypothetical protein [Candidatus Acidoferrales bacterium]
TEQVALGDVISIDWKGGEMGLTFLKEAEGALVPMDSPVPDPMTEAAAAISDGRELSFPATAGATAEVAPPMPSQRVVPVEKARNEKR